MNSSYLKTLNINFQKNPLGGEYYSNPEICAGDLIESTIETEQILPKSETR
jgi:hypothetical protein